MTEENTIFTDEELANIDYAIVIGTAVCAGVATPGGGAICALVGGTFSSAVHGIDWIWDNVIPDSWKAKGAFSWSAPYVPLFKKFCETHEQAVQVVDETWRRMRAEKGLPPQPSPAGAFLNDWVNRNGWRDAGRKDYRAEGKTRWITLDPDNGPWAYRKSGMPMRPEDSTVNAYVSAILELINAKRLGVLEAGIRATLEFIALDISGSRWKVDAGIVREASWVHGTAFECERQHDHYAARKMGWGTRYSADAGRALWFHVQIPAPVLINDVRPVCSKVFLLYETAGCRLSELHIYDGFSKVLEIPNLSGSGKQNHSLNASNSWLLFPFPTVQSGLGLSALVQFQNAPSGGSEAERPWVTFSTAGADFNRSR